VKHPSSSPSGIKEILKWESQIPIKHGSPLINKYLQYGYRANKFFSKIRKLNYPFIKHE